MSETEIAPQVLAELQALPLERGRPLLAVDADEVLVVFVDHLHRYIRTLGFEMRLVRYELEGSIFPIGSDDPIPFADCIDLINRFFGSETLTQEAVPGAAEALQSLVFACGRERFDPLRAWFTALYEVLLGASQGPRFGGFITLYGVEETIALIDKALAGELS